MNTYVVCYYAITTWRSLPLILMEGKKNLVNRHRSYVRQDDVDKLAKLRQIFGHSKITSS